MRLLPIVYSVQLKEAYHQIPLSDIDKAYTAFEAVDQLWQFTGMPFGIKMEWHVSSVQCMNVLKKKNFQKHIPVWIT